jgi:hypothetical protein
MSSVEGKIVERKAQCSCGNLSIVIEGEPKEVCVCNCFACQKYTGSAFGVSTYWPKSAVKKIGGTSAMFRWISEAGRWIDKHFCSRCGDTVYWYVEFDLDAVGIPIGQFDDPLSLRPQISYWTKFKHPWVELSADIQRL